MPGGCSIGEKSLICWKAQTSLPFGRKCFGTKVDSARICHIHQLGYSPGLGGGSTQELQTSSPKPPCLAKYCHCWLKNRIYGSYHPHHFPTVADVDTARCTIPPSGTDRENWYLLVITASAEQLSLGPSSDKF